MPAVHRPAGVRRVLRAARADRRKDDVNQRIAEALDDARIPVVLLDRTVVALPATAATTISSASTTGAPAIVITEHLLRLGSPRIAFVALPHAAATVDAREAGYREALYAWNVADRPALVHRLDPSDVQCRASRHGRRTAGRVRLRERSDRRAADAGTVAARLRHSGGRPRRRNRRSGVREPLPVPLTTLRQPTRQIGDAALAAMLERVARTHLPARDILLHCELIVRESCGGTPAGDQEFTRSAVNTVTPPNCS